jgi:hypothetical protein
LETSSLALIEALPRYLPGKNEKKSCKLSIRIDDVPAKTGTEHLPITDLERYRYASLLCMIRFNVKNSVSYMPINVRPRMICEVSASMRTETVMICCKLLIWRIVGHDRRRLNVRNTKLER